LSAFKTKPSQRQHFYWDSQKKAVMRKEIQKLYNHIELRGEYMKRRVEFLLPVIMVSLMIFGLIVLYSATFGDREEYLFGRQLVWVLLSCAVFVSTAYVVKRGFWKRRKEHKKVN